MTYVERKEELKLLISFDDSKWICGTLWKHFFTTMGASASDDFEKMIEQLNPGSLTEKQHLLEESVLYARIAALMVEADLQERQHSSNMFTFESQTSGDTQGSCLAGHLTQTGLASEDALVEEAVQLNELALMGSMLLSLIKFDVVCARAAAQ